MFRYGFVVTEVARLSLGSALLLGIETQREFRYGFLGRRNSTKVQRTEKVLLQTNCADGDLI